MLQQDAGWGEPNIACPCPKTASSVYRMSQLHLGDLPKNYTGIPAPESSGQPCAWWDDHDRQELVMFAGVGQQKIVSQARSKMLRLAVI